MSKVVKNVLVNIFVFYTYMYIHTETYIYGFPGGTGGKEPAC